ncbi:hypothetical protein H8E77_43095 [bacterium]|nr:hypothetical protein [bacterium]
MFIAYRSAKPLPQLRRSDLQFEIFYGLSNNDLRWSDIENARRKIGYIPQDRAEDNHDYDSALNSSMT